MFELVAVIIAFISGLFGGLFSYPVRASLADATYNFLSAVLP